MSQVMAAVDNRAAWLDTQKTAGKWNQSAVEVEFDGRESHQFRGYPPVGDKEEDEDDEDTLVSSGTETDSEQPLVINENRSPHARLRTPRHSDIQIPRKHQPGDISSDSENSCDSEHSYNTSYSTSSASCSDSSDDILSDSSDSSSSISAESSSASASSSDSSSESESEGEQALGKREGRPQAKTRRVEGSRGGSNGGGDGGGGVDEDVIGAGQRCIANAISRPEEKTESPTSSSVDRRHSPPMGTAEDEEEDDDMDDEEEEGARRPGVASKVVMASAPMSSDDRRSKRDDGDITGNISTQRSVTSRNCSECSSTCGKLGSGYSKCRGNIFSERGNGLKT